MLTAARHYWPRIALRPWLASGSSLLRRAAATLARLSGWWEMFVPTSIGSLRGFDRVKLCPWCSELDEGWHRCERRLLVLCGSCVGYRGVAGRWRLGHGRYHECPIHGQRTIFLRRFRHEGKTLPRPIVLPDLRPASEYDWQRWKEGDDARA